MSAIGLFTGYEEVEYWKCQLDRIIIMKVMVDHGREPEDLEFYQGTYSGNYDQYAHFEENLKMLIEPLAITPLEPSEEEDHGEASFQLKFHFREDLSDEEQKKLSYLKKSIKDFSSVVEVDGIYGEWDEKDPSVFRITMESWTGFGFALYEFMNCVKAIEPYLIKKEAPVDGGSCHHDEEESSPTHHVYPRGWSEEGDLCIPRSGDQSDLLVAK